MLDLIVYALLLGIVLAVAYAIYLIPPVKRVVRRFADAYRDFLLTVGFAIFAAALMYFIILPRM